jgi:hypothetical protein
VINTHLDVVLIGSSTPLTAAIQGSGAPVPVTPQWSTENAAIVTVESTGVLRGIANGTARVTATYGSLTDSFVVRVAPNYNGQWAGTYRLTSCAQDASFPISTLCTSAGAAPTNALGLTIVQNKLVANGTLSLSFGDAPVTGTIEPDGALMIGGQVRMAPYTVSVGEWRMTSAPVPVAGGGTRDRLTGLFGLTWSADGSAGLAHMTAATDDLAKTGS